MRALERAVWVLGWRTVGYVLGLSGSRMWCSGVEKKWVLSFMVWEFSPKWEHVGVPRLRYVTHRVSVYGLHR